MPMSNQQQKIEQILQGTGIKINGKNPWDIKINNNGFFKRVLTEGEMGFGESYMDGWWDCDDLEEMFYRMFRANLENKIKKDFKLTAWLLVNKFVNISTKERSKKVGELHYDAGNDLYEIMLGKWMTYTGDYWKNAKSLEQAQEAKLDLICRKLDLKKGQRILDIGCGFGNFCRFAASKYGVHATGVTVSKEQAKYGQEAGKGLPVDIKVKDYRDVTGKYDHVVSIGMFEHVGHKSYRSFMELVNRSLSDKGLFFMEVSGSNVSVYGNTHPWGEKYIFPNSHLPSLAQIGKATEELFIMEDLQNIGYDYYLSIMEWEKRFEKGWPKIAEKYGERFYRMWRLYLLSMGAMGRTRTVQNWQMVFSKVNPPQEKVYDSIR